ncbi:MAG: 3-deoxy-D-manno-octulosonic acid kinase [Opitutales bacterium]
MSPANSQLQPMSVRPLPSTGPALVRAWCRFLVSASWKPVPGNARLRAERRLARPWQPRVAPREAAPEKAGVVFIQRGGDYFYWDADFLRAGDPRYFDVGWLRGQGLLTGQATGRSAAWLIREGNAAWVLRHYFRGGLVGRWNRDTHISILLRATRPWREFTLLRELRRRGLPVPRPLGIRLARRGWFYRADLLMERIADVRSLAERLAEPAGLSPATWASIGRHIARLHQAGADHADLNCRNVLLDSGGGVWLIDFDRGRLRQPGPWRLRNLARLKRSLDKEARKQPGLAWSRRHWQSLLLGYSRACF